MTAERFVLARHDAGGTVPPMLAVAQALTARGHDVTVLGQRCVEQRARAVAGSVRRALDRRRRDDRPIEDQIEAAVPMMTATAPGSELLATIDATGGAATLGDPGTDEFWRRPSLHDVRPRRSR